MWLVGGGFLFILIFIGLSKVIGDGPIMPIIFVVGWLTLAVVFVYYFKVVRKRSD